MPTLHIYLHLRTVHKHDVYCKDMFQENRKASCKCHLVVENPGGHLMVIISFVLKDFYRIEITPAVVKHVLDILFSLSGTLFVIKFLFGILRKTYRMFP